MASASGVWNQETKHRLNEKINSNINDMGSLVRQITRGSKSTELLAQAAKNFASQEQHIQNSLEALRKMDIVRSQLEFQEAAIARSLVHLDEVQDQLATIK
ncbi:BLOC-1-related complex subunit 7-like isoform X2 [Babylonia areolata]|uniref:BLOC-1-related complex subunit 7-like isoform X2 n=1 Tax=Babylonia areolata TaxID=304850 RepID=UPI003FD3C1F0